MTHLRRLSTATAAATLALVAIGGLVRATGSGDACPDWPRCFGSWLPPLEAHAVIEYSHRLSAVVAGLLILVTAWVSWRRERDPGVLWPMLAAVVVVVVQAGIGRVRIVGGPKAIVVTIHFLVAMSLVALVMIAATAARVRRGGPRKGDPAGPGFRATVWWTLAVTGVLLLVGAYVRGQGAGLVFLDWPLMDGRLVPDLSTEATVAGFLHRLLAGAAVVLGAVLAIRARRVQSRGIRLLAWTAFGLLLAQAAVGAAAVLTSLSPPAVAGHVTGGSLAWAALVALGAAVHRLRPRPEPARRRAREMAGAYLQLMKPDIIVLLLVTTVPAMVLAAGRVPPWDLVLATLLGGVLAAGGAGAINCYVDRDIDEVMARTRRRPIPSHRIDPEDALRFGVVLVVAGFLWLWAAVNLLSAALAAGAALFYVLVYTLWLKRSSPQNIVIGGAAGAMPAVVGWAAVTGSVELPAMVLFAIVFLWTPPHFWALALRHAGEYASAGVPMLPVVRGRHETGLHILYYSLQLFAVSLLLYPAARLGELYLAAAVVLGAVLIGHAVRVLRDSGSRAALALFRYSITYLGLLFAAAAADQLIRG